MKWDISIAPPTTIGRTVESQTVESQSSCSKTGRIMGDDAVYGSGTTMQARVRQWKAELLRAGWGKII